MERLTISEYDWDFSVQRPYLFFWPRGINSNLRCFLKRIRMLYNPRAGKLGWPDFMGQEHHDELSVAIYFGLCMPGEVTDAWNDKNAVESANYLKEQVSKIPFGISHTAYPSDDPSPWILFRRTNPTKRIETSELVYETYIAIVDKLLQTSLKSQHPDKVTQENYVRRGELWIPFAEDSFQRFRQKRNSPKFFS